MFLMRPKPGAAKPRETFLTDGPPAQLVDNVATLANGPAVAQRGALPSA
jgi:hypothetical protein